MKKIFIIIIIALIIITIGKTPHTKGEHYNKNVIELSGEGHMEETHTQPSHHGEEAEERKDNRKAREGDVWD